MVGAADLGAAPAAARSAEPAALVLAVAGVGGGVVFAPPAAPVLAVSVVAGGDVFAPPAAPVFAVAAVLGGHPSAPAAATVSTLGAALPTVWWAERRLHLLYVAASPQAALPAAAVWLLGGWGRWAAGSAADAWPVFMDEDGPHAGEVAEDMDVDVVFSAMT